MYVKLSAFEERYPGLPLPGAAVFHLVRENARSAIVEVLWAEYSDTEGTFAAQFGGGKHDGARRELRRTLNPETEQGKDAARLGEESERDRAP